MTDPSRGARSRRSGRRPGWLLLTVLLVLAIAASSALVFTQRVELLKLAVILSLWAAAAAAFVSVIYRRQSDIDRAKARDLKLVYDLQLDREISARREYELEVESQLRRELAIEVRAQAADEVASLRAELAALRNNLEILFDADLSHRPAIEPERTTVRAYSDWQRDGPIAEPGPRPPRFVASTPRLDADDGSENAIIDVPEEPPVPVEEVRPAPEPRHSFDFEPRPQPAPASSWQDSPAPGGYYGPEPGARPYPAPDPFWLPPPPPEPQPAEPGGRHGVHTPGPADWQWSPPVEPGTSGRRLTAPPPRPPSRCPRSRSPKNLRRIADVIRTRPSRTRCRTPRGRRRGIRPATTTSRRPRRLTGRSGPASTARVTASRSRSCLRGCRPALGPPGAAVAGVATAEVPFV